MDNTFILDLIVFGSDTQLKFNPCCVHRASDQSPATIISSSSPEAGFEEKHPILYPGLRLISNKKENEDQERDCISPQVPIICPIALKGKR